MRGLKARLPGWLTPELQPPRYFTYNDTGIDTDEALDNVETGIDCDADATTAIPAGSIIKIDTEFMFVTTTGTTLTVVRPNPVAHDTNADIYKKVNNCVLWLPGQDDAYSGTIKDKSGNNNHGTIIGAIPTRLPSGLLSLQFGPVADDYVSVASNTSLDITDGFTIEFWTKYTGAVLGGMVDRRGGSGEGYILLFYSDGTIITVLNDGVNQLVTVYGSGYNDNKWHHGVWTGSLSSDLARVIVDGVQVGVDTDISSITGAVNPAKNLTLGRYDATGSNTIGYMALSRVTTAVSTYASQHYNQERHLFGV